MYALYFAYGSNMHPVQMRERCPGARPAGIGMLRGWCFRITTRGTAAIVREPGRVVYGVLWRCAPSHFHALDRYEGVHWRNYRRRMVTIETENNGAARAVTYVTNRRYPGRVRLHYMTTAVLPGAEAFGLPEHYVAELRSWLPDRPVGDRRTRYRGRTRPARVPR